MPLAICFAESDQIAQTISGLLSGGHYQIESSPSTHTPTKYHFKHVIAGEMTDFIFTSLKTPPCSIVFAENINPDDPFSFLTVPLQRITSPTFSEYFRALIQQAHQIFLFLNSTLESEIRCRDIAYCCSNFNSTIQIYRVRFSGLTFEELNSALDNARPLSYNYATAASFKEDQYFRIRKIFSKFEYQVLFDFTKGKKLKRLFHPCERAILGIIYKSMEDFQNYQPEEKYTLEPIFQTGEILTWSREWIFCKLSCFVLFRTTFVEPDSNSYAHLVSIEEKQIKKQKPYGLTTFKLIEKAWRYFKINPIETLEVATELYENGLISCPYTKADTFPDNFNFQRILSILLSHSEFTDDITYVRENFEKPLEGPYSNDYQLPIYPISLPQFPLTGSRKDIYIFIVRSFLAICSQNAYAISRLFTFDICGETFTYEDARISQYGFLSVYPYISSKKWKPILFKTQHEVPMKEWKQDDCIPLSQFNMKKSITDQPKLLTPSYLFKLIERAGICEGEEAVDYLKKLINKKLIVYDPKESGDEYRPLPFGAALYLAYQKIGNVSQYISSYPPKIEAAVACILTGRLDSNRAAMNLRENDINAIESVRNQLNVIFQALQAIIPSK